MAGVASSLGAIDLSVVATSAVREADNQQEFLDLAKEVAGVEVEVISGFEEARLIHLGVLQALAVYEKRLLVVDIGGGSTEFILGEGGEPLETRSMKLGAIRLTERFFDDDTTTADAIDACRQYVRNALTPIVLELGGFEHEIAIGSSGTISTVASMIASARGEPRRQLNGASFTVDELEDLVTRLVGTTQADRQKFGGMDAKRVDIIVGGAVLLIEIFESLGLTAMTVSEFALREGVLLDRFGGSTSAGLERLSDLRRSNVERLANQLDPDAAHARHCAFLATQLFDATASVHGLGPELRELLWSAAILHNVGLFISHSSHHKHSYYVIRNSEYLTGFTQQEIELIAVIARYHRRSHPTEKHREFAVLSTSDKEVVCLLAGMLRLAIGLDRRHAGSVSSVRVLMEDRPSGVTDESERPGPRAIIELTGGPGADLDLEIYAATERSQLLAKSLGASIRIRPPHPVTGGRLSS
jgi:exopolyphosphatase/guanosine-5'-triphosphate,3'-diphosphate pyrophosphatase